MDAKNCIIIAVCVKNGGEVKRTAFQLWHKPIKYGPSHLVREMTEAEATQMHASGYWISEKLAA